MAKLVFTDAWLAENALLEHFAGFVHLPRIPQVNEADRAMLRTVVEHVVGESVRTFREHR